MIRAAVAQGWGSAVSQACRRPFPDCTRCRRPGSVNIRESWGCDAPSRRVVWSSSCPSCTGGDPDCTRCEGRGEVDYNRCPSSIISEAPPGLRMSLDLLMRAYSHYDRRNVLPAQGAWLDQSRSFLLAVDLIDAERGWWERILSDFQEREAKRAQAKANQGGRR